MDFGRQQDRRGLPVSEGGSSSRSYTGPTMSPTVLASGRVFSVRPASAGDEDGILGCLVSAFEGYRDRYTPGAFADTVLDSESLRRRMGEMVVLVAVAGGKIVGTIGGAAHGAQGHLRGMAVIPEWQGTGAAAALLAAIETELEKRGCNVLTLDTTEPLERAIRFYSHHGYAPTGRAVEFFGMQLYEYSKKLGPR